MTREFWALAGIITFNLQGCTTPGAETRAAPIVEFAQKNSALGELRGAQATVQPRTESISPDTPAVPSAGAPEPESAPAFVQPSAPIPETRANAPIATHPAALALLNEAMRQAKSGDLELAAAKLERALRIEPRNPLLWHQLAAVRFRQGQTQLAAGLAHKSNSYVAQNTELAARNQRIIDRSRSP